jgi:hypothetical protein
MAKATKTTKTAEEVAMAKNEKHNDGTMSGLKKTMIGTIGTLVTAGGAFLMTYMQKPKENDKQVQPQSININIPQQQQVAGGNKTVIINKGGGTTPAAAPKPKKKEGDEFKEKPAQW